VKRFYREARAAGSAIELDGRPVRTPARHALELPTAALAEAVAEEWAGQGETIDPRAMPLTGLANAAIDRVAPDPDAFAAGLAVYGESDLTCYRAEAPPRLVERQAERWDPILAWARSRFDVDFVVTSGIVHRPQPPATIARLAAATAARSPFALAGLAPLVTISGSLLVGLAVAEAALGVEAAWEAAALDEAWQAETWGEDAEAAAALAARRREFLAAARFLALLEA
jgi:chaperone required for assembly of F1-ATPase